MPTKKVHQIKSSQKDLSKYQISFASSHHTTSHHTTPPFFNLTYPALSPPLILFLILRFEIERLGDWRIGEFEVSTLITLPRKLNPILCFTLFLVLHSSSFWLPYIYIYILYHAFRLFRGVVLGLALFLFFSFLFFSFLFSFFCRSDFVSFVVISFSFVVCSIDCYLLLLLFLFGGMWSG